MEADIINRFKEADVSDFPDFHLYKTPLAKGLWILWIAKEKLRTKKLNAEEIASVIRDVQETSIDAKSIIKAFNRAGDKIHTYREDDVAYFEIMKSGKDYLISLVRKGSVKLFYFEPGKRYSTKNILAKDVLDELKGELRVMDPYCGQRALDVLKDISNRTVKFLTRQQNLRERDRNRFLRELQDFKSEYSNFEFRNYSLTDIHDRYIISENSLVILGHSLKDLGSKESFAIVLDSATNKNIIEALLENFNRRWKASEML